MSPEDFRILREKLQSERTQILVSKGKDYSGDLDILSNFKKKIKKCLNIYF